MRRLVHVFAGGLTALIAALGMALAGPSPAIEASGAPRAIPTLQQWTPGTGSFAFTSGSRIVVDGAYGSELGSAAATFADDLQSLKGFAVGQVTGTSATAQPGDIFLTLGSTDTTLGTEGYRLTVATSITIQAITEVGVFEGTRTVLQLLEQGSSIAAGTARDYPAYPDRGLMVDVGRKYFSIAFLQNQIRDMAYLKLNYLHLHFSDNLGFRLESQTHPEIVSAQHYTKQEIKDLIALGERYHVTIIPEIDMPGHMDTILAAHTNLRLTSSTGVASTSYIDLTNPASYTLMQDLIQEFTPLFPSIYWHLGADEYVTNYSQYPQLLTYARAHYGPNATAKDTYYGFIKWADGIVRAAGKTMRIWNDGIAAGDGTVTVPSDIAVDYWYDKGLTVQQQVDAGRAVLNSSYSSLYYVLHSGDTGIKPNDQYLYETWTPNIFHGGLTLSDPTKNEGAKLHVWCDYPAAETEDQVAAGIMPTLRVLAQQTWGSPKLVATYAGFQPIITALGRAPGYGTPPNPVPSPTATPSGPPAPPTAVVGTATGNGDVTVSWTAPAVSSSPVQAYAVYAYSAASGTGTVSESIGTSTVVTALTPNTYYTFTITAYNSSGWSGWSAWASWVLVS